LYINKEKSVHNFKLFVYGTLKRGQYNHSVLEAHCTLLEELTLPRKGIMFHADAFPVLCMDEPLTPIMGEIYDCPREILARTDRLEGYPDLYDRHQLAIPPYGLVYVYVQNKTDCDSYKKIIPDGNWKGSGLRTTAVQWLGWGKGAVGLDINNELPWATEDRREKPMFETFISVQSLENKEEFFIVNTITGQNFGPYKHKGWMTSDEGVRKPKISPAVSAEVQKVMNPDKRAVSYLPVPSTQNTTPIPVTIITKDVCVEKHIIGPGAVGA